MFFRTRPNSKLFLASHFHMLERALSQFQFYKLQSQLSIGMSKQSLSIEIISDIICPWCWVGKRKLEKALETYKVQDFQIVWRPYQLRPDTPMEGKPKAPDTPNNPRVGSRLKAAGASVGINFTGKTDRTPNTLLGHALLEHTLEKHGWKKQNEVQEALFQAYFTDGVFPDENNLISIANEHGVDSFRFAVSDPSLLGHVRDNIKENYTVNHGHGVPFFIVNGKPAFAGAQDPSTFHQVFDAILDEE